MEKFVCKNCTLVISLSLVIRFALAPFFSDRVVVQQWMQERFNWEIKDLHSICFSPGIVAGLTLCVEAFSRQNDVVCFLTPTYYPFFAIVHNTSRQLATVALKRNDKRYEIDFELLEKTFKDKNPKIFICKRFRCFDVSIFRTVFLFLSNTFFE
jgi:hypothetical protein